MYIALLYYKSVCTSQKKNCGILYNMAGKYDYTTAVGDLNAKTGDTAIPNYYGRTQKQ
jgi:hypothetical protein